MENLRKLTDQVLLEQTSTLVKVERETTTLVLHHLQEVERRRLFAKRGFSSLFSYCVEALGYSESSAQRRISSMRLLKSLEPEVALAVEMKIQEGSLSLSVLAQAQTFFQEEAKFNQGLSPSEKKEVLCALEGMSARAATRELQDRSSQEVSPIKEYTRPASHCRTEIHLVVDQATLERLEKIKGLLSHLNPNMGWGALVDHIAQIAWQKLDPAREPANRRKDVTCAQAGQAEVKPKSPPQSAMDSSENASTERAALPTSAVGRKRVSTALKREVWRKCDGKCSYVDSVTGKVCGSRQFLQIEHVVPVAHGGKNDIFNCTLRCFSHNQLAAIQVFGQSALEKHVPSLR
jgi:5-methylcytosine-specific restriction endonuclease McrA